MKTYNNGPKGMRYGGMNRKPMMYGGGISAGIKSFKGKKPKKKQMGGMATMNTSMMQPTPMAGAMTPQKMAKGGKAKFPDLTGDGKVTQADILKGRGVSIKKKRG